MKPNLKIINSKDNVGVLLEEFENIPAGHKIALKDIAAGEYVFKYGEIIGRAYKDIKKGEWVHSHNLKTNLEEKKEYSYNFNASKLSLNNDTFLGYKRENGQVGIRNDIFIIPTVGCVNTVCKKLEKLAQSYINGSVDSVVALTHQFGCSQLGEDALNIKKILCSIALNPNATYVLFVGLGCENNSLSGIKEHLEKYNRKNIFFLNCQDYEDEVAEGLSILKDLISKASILKREEVSFDKLCIGLKCGGSDGYSGITANPLVGKVSDYVISCGGSAILTEVPEMFGAEQILMNKCASKEIFDRYSKLIENFKNYYKENNFPIYENPSPGNKAGGITTLEEKSCGCITKAGSSKIVDVLDYGDLVKENGLSVLNGPGNDLIAATTLGASGCQIVLFTTGRGTPFSTFVPTIKIGTNKHVSNFKNNWIDFNAFDGELNDLIKLLKDTINGTNKLSSEENKEIAFYKKGVTL